jgi:hypothetical protein
MYIKRLLNYVEHTSSKTGGKKLPFLTDLAERVYNVPDETSLKINQ